MCLLLMHTERKEDMQGQAHELTPNTHAHTHGWDHFPENAGVGVCVWGGEEWADMLPLFAPWCPLEASININQQAGLGS